MKSHSLRSRRDVLKAGAFAVAVPFASRVSWASGSPMQKLQYAPVAVAGRGAADISSISRHEKVRVVAGADVDAKALAKFTPRHKGARAFSDWREMLDKMGKSIDVVSVSTPDHMHGIISMSAMNMKKHVYVQKPLAQNIGECRAMLACAQRNKVVVQMGNQCATSHDRVSVELVQRGVIGKVTEVWAFCRKTWGDSKAPPGRRDPVPRGLDWDGWLGVAADRPYRAKYYHPKNWRRRQELGSGALGDMGCHILNAPYRGLSLTAPKRARSRTGVPNVHNWTNSEHVEYDFPATPLTDGDIKLHWVSGNRRPPQELTDQLGGAKLKFGSLLKGTDGILMLRHGGTPSLFPEDKFKGVQPAKVERMGHHASFVDAVVSGDQGRLQSPIDYAAPMTAFVLLGNIAMQHSPGWLDWDSRNWRITNNEAANKEVDRVYRKGWEVMGA